jgi:hypothetical protein
MKIQLIAVLSLGLWAGNTLAQSKQFVCAGLGGASSLGKVTVTVPTKVEVIQGAFHHIGTVTIGTVNRMSFWVSWDATGSSMSVGRSDGDGFEASAIADGGDLVILRSKKPGEVEVQIACSPR